MRKPLALTAYLALNQTGPRTPSKPPPRPKGPLVWVHCADPSRLATVEVLAAMLTEEGDQITVLTTTEAPARPIAGLLLQPIPDDNTRASEAFLDHWQPDSLVWLNGPLQPAIIAAASERRIHRLLLDVTETRPDLPARTRVPGLARAVLGLFDHGVCADRRGVLRLERAGLRASQIKQAMPFDPGPRVLPCHEDERADLAKVLASRPVWLAAGAQIEELPALLAAYQHASSHAHRLLFVVATNAPEDAIHALRVENPVICDYLNGDLLTDATQVLLTDTSEMGMWYRLAPLTYIGGTLGSGAVLDPFDAAALGSVVIHGMATGPYQYRFDQLADAQACRMVRTAADLGREVETLLSPDKAAQMAHAAWDVTSRGAETGTLVAGMIREALDMVDG